MEDNAEVIDNAIEDGEVQEEVMVPLASEVAPVKKARAKSRTKKEVVEDMPINSGDDIVVENKPAKRERKSKKGNEIKVQPIVDIPNPPMITYEEEPLEKYTKEIDDVANNMNEIYKNNGVVSNKVIDNIVEKLENIIK
jgi:hypothetical protein